MSPPPIAVLQAGPGWRAVDCISDLHLQASEPMTFQAWQAWMASADADAIVILGDLFEAWPGDDVVQAGGFEARCADVLREAASRLPVFFMHGNRDFLVGDSFARQTGIRLLSDPTVLAFPHRRWLLTHGDALCLADTQYLRFRAMVRDPRWQHDFLAQPLAARQQMVQAIRAESESRKQPGATYADVDRDEALAWLAAADADTLVHGHTHRPGEEQLDAKHERIVLTDWDLAATAPRGEVLRLTAESAQRLPLA